MLRNRYYQIPMHPNVVTPNKFVSSSSVPQVPNLISSLPEGILISILSRLTTRDAVQTSVLSSKWINLWTSITKVDFDDTLFDNKYWEIDKEKMTTFVNFVNRVLLHLDNATIEDFSLLLSNHQYDPNVTSSWISAALKKQVQNLHIQNADNAFISSRSLANCSSLVQLVLDMNCTINVPSLYCLQNLQVLRLDRVRIINTCPTNYSKEIVLNFPSLKVFEARQSVLFNIVLQAPMLESFSFILFDHSLTSSELIELQSSVFKICASPSRISYRGHLLHDSILVDQSSTVKGFVEIIIDEYMEERIQRTCFRSQMLLRQFHDAECMKLRLNQLIQGPNEHYFANLPVFRRLIYLEVEIVGAVTLLNILTNSKNLKTLVINNAAFSSEEDVMASIAVPQCFQSSLKDVQFKKFRGISCEFILAKIVLGNAAVLEKMSIFPQWLLRNSDIEFNEIKWKILSFPRKSSVVSIDIWLQC